jgi:hypothetical protein
MLATTTPMAMRPDRILQRFFMTGPSVVYVKI